MTFILSHADALRKYRPVFAGAHRVRGLELPLDRVVTANAGGLSGKVAEFLFRRFGVAGGFAHELHRFQPAVVHAHFGPAGPSGLALADALGLPLVVTYHGRDATITDDESRRSWRGREYLRGRSNLIRRAALFIAVSNFIRGRLLATGFPAEKVVTHRNGIDLDIFNGSGGPREPVALFVGRFVEKKGCEFLLRALARLRANGYAARGVLVGDGPLRPQLERVAAEEGACAEFTGFLPPAEVRAWLGRASVVVVPSVTAADGDSEGLPTVILEAQAMRTPVVTTRHAGNSEGVQEGKSALLVEERDVTGLAEAIRFFLEEPAAIESFGIAGRAFVQRHFSLKEQATGLEYLYDRVRGAAAPAPAGTAS